LNPQSSGKRINTDARREASLPLPSQGGRKETPMDTKKRKKEREEEGEGKRRPANE